MAIPPPVPSSLAAAGNSESLVEQLVMKILYFRGEMAARDLAFSVGFRYSVIEPVLETLKYQHLIAVKRALGVGHSSAILTLSDAGRTVAREHLLLNQYCGRAPVPMDHYYPVVRAQRLREQWLTPDMLARAYRNLVVSPEVLSQIGPAVSAGKSFLIYGEPGDGKSALAEALFDVESTPVYIPYALETEGRIIQVYDPVYHHAIEISAGSATLAQEPDFDQRWFLAPRPFIVTGGELTLEMLDLSYNDTTNIYKAPFHVKANNGTYLIDDFGRQRVKPADILNRWIVPMERGTDYLNFRTGGKLPVPFETFLIFSTNLNPQTLGDEAFLRRIQYKMRVYSPDPNEFSTIFTRVCEQRQIACEAGLLRQFIERRYLQSGKAFRRCHPRDVITHAVDIMRFERLEPVLTGELLDRAFASCFIEEC